MDNGASYRAEGTSQNSTLRAMILGGSYLDELAEFPTDDHFKAAYDDLTSEFQGSPIGSQRIIELVTKQLLDDPSSFSSSRSKDWWSYIDVLIESKEHALSEGNSQLDELGELFGSMVFAPAFRRSTHAFVCDLFDATVDLDTIDFDKISLKEPVEAFLIRLIDVSQYVLYLDSIRSGFGYTKWCGQFDKDPSDNPWKDLSSEYPVLIRYLAETAASFTAHLTEALTRLSDDRCQLQEVFGIEVNDSLIELDPLLSDPHHGGRTVIRMRFRSGKTLIYKPKPIAVEEYFNEFVHSQDTCMGFASIRVLNRVRYGWVEDAVTRAKQRVLLEQHVGRATAWLWLLNATDMHSENLIQGDRGIFGLDLETLLSVNPSDTLKNLQDTWRDFSITSTLLYDAALPGSASEIGYSGFNPQDFVRLPYAQAIFSVQDDKISLTKLSSQKINSGPESSLSRAKSDAGDILEGFSDVVGSLVPLAKEFTNGIPDTTELRVILRPTNFYYQLLHRIRQPKYLRSGALTSIELYRLFHSTPLFGEHTSRADVDRIIIDEIEQVKAQDIPYFSRTAGGTEIVTSTDAVGSYTAMSGKQKALKKLNSIGPGDIAEQCSLLATALGRPSLDDISRRSNGSTVSKAEVSSGHGKLESKVGELTEDIMASSFVSAGSMPRWTCVSGSVDVTSLRAYAGDTSFFSGSLGILLGIQAAASTLGNASAENASFFLERHAGSVVERLTRFNDQDEGQLQSLGYTGLGGHLFSISVLYGLDPDRWAEVPPILEGLMKGANDRISRDRWLDVVAGSAGLIMGCEQVLRYAPKQLADSAEDLMAEAAGHIARSAQSFGEYKAWTIPDERLPLVGYAHGWAGIVSALLVAQQRSGTEVSRKQILDTIEESVAFPVAELTAEGTWLDYRGSLDPLSKFPPVNRSWCNGTSGILRGLLNLQDRLPPSLKPVTSSLLEMQDATHGEVTRFCCGSVADVDFLVDSPSRTPLDQLLQLTEQTVTKTLADIDDELARDLPERFYASLFQGKAGVVYSALRVLNPSLPSLSGPALWTLR